jgi:hypothetical protein
MTGKKDAVDYTIKPSAAKASIDTSDWPLLLKVCRQISYQQLIHDI